MVASALSSSRVLGDLGAVVAGEPDLVHAVVEADDPVFRDRLPHVVDDPLRRRRPAAFPGPVGDMGEDVVAQADQSLRPRQLAFEPVGEEREAGADVADKLRLGKEHFLDRRRQIADMQHRRPVRPHEERRLLHRVMADRDDEIGPVDRPMDIVALGQRRGPHVERGPAGDRPFAHLRIEERDLHPLHERRQRIGEAGSARAGAEHDERPLGGEDQLRRAVERRARRDRRVDRMRRDRDHIRPRLVGDVLGKFEMDWAGPLLLRDPERLAHQRGNGRGRDDLAGHLGQGRHGRDDVHDLKAGLLAAEDSLLAGDHHHRHRAEQRVSRAGGQIERARPERREADPGPAGQAPVRRRHERRRLLVAGQHQPDLRTAQGFDDVEILFARDAEDLLDALVLERRDEELGAVQLHAPQICPESAPRESVSLSGRRFFAMEQDGGLSPAGQFRLSLGRLIQGKSPFGPPQPCLGRWPGGRPLRHGRACPGDPHWISVRSVSGYRGSDIGDTLLRDIGDTLLTQRIDPIVPIYRTLRLRWSLWGTRVAGIGLQDHWGMSKASPLFPDIEISVTLYSINE